MSNLPVPAQEAKRAVIKVKGNVVKNVDLTEQSGSNRISVKGPRGLSVLQIEGGKVKMLSSPCPDKLCVRQGWAEKPGEAIVCVPNAVSVSIEGDGGVDAIIR